MADSALCPADECLFSIGEAAALTGVSTDTIRAWERRHRVVSPGRTSSHHRRYSEADVQTLRDVRELVRSQGMPVGAAVRLVKREPLGRGRATPAPAPAVERNPVTLDLARDVWHSVLNLIPELFLLIDVRGTIVAVNAAVAKVVGEVRERLSGRRFGDLVDAHDRAKAMSLFREPLRPRRGWELNLRTRARAGFYAFDCWPLPGEPALLALIGTEVGVGLARASGA